MTGGLTRKFADDERFLVLMLGLCPAAAAATRLIDALWMSLGVFLVLVLSSLCVSLIARASQAPAAVSAGPVPPGRWIGALLITSCLAASFEVVLAAFAPEARGSLGIYAPLIAVNFLVLTRLESAGKGGSLGGMLLGSARSGAGFAAALVAIGLVREFLGSGTITLFAVGSFSGTLVIPSLSDNPVRALAFSGGALLSLGYFAAAIRIIRRKRGAAKPAESGSTAEGGAA
ncbi:MAG: Rnf-Nqr domain containing protein [Spirochaetia bacterium]|jgi:electron transport complex protein RnfE